MITKPKTMPELRFPGFEEEWNRTKLANTVSSIDSGWSPQCSDQPAESSDWGILKTTSVVWNGYNEGANKRLLPGSEPREQIEVKVCDILITRAGPSERVGVVAHVDRTRPMLMLSDKIIRLRCDDLADSRFIARCVSSKESQDHLLGRKSGLAKSQTNISQNDLKSVPITIPTLPEQRKIADFLTAVDGRIQQLRQKKALLEDYKKGVMQQLFTQALRFKDDHGNEFPEWEEKKLGEIGTITTGKTPSTSDEAAWIGETMFVTPTDIGEDTKFQHTTIRHVNGEKLRLIPKHSLMFTCIASVGKMSIATEPCITNQQINSVSVGPGSFFEFVYYALRHLTPQIKATQANTTLPIINKTEFSKFVLPVPNLPEQTKIANFLTALDRKIESVAQQIRHTQAFKKGLLQQMFV
jgi:type I restriction enzyme, S subunit